MVRERDALARDGVVFVNLLMDHKSGELIEDPMIITKGFIYQHESKDLLDEARQYIEKYVDNVGDDVPLQSSLEKSLRNFFHRETKRRPMIFVVVNEN